MHDGTNFAAEHLMSCEKGYRPNQRIQVSARSILTENVNSVATETFWRKRHANLCI